MAGYVWDLACIEGSGALESRIWSFRTSMFEKNFGIAVRRVGFALRDLAMWSVISFDPDQKSDR